jgi:hypothetical protein
MKTVLSVTITICFVFLMFATPCLAEERTIFNYGLSIGFNNIIPIFGSEKETVNNIAYGFAIGVIPTPEMSLFFSGGIRFFNGDSGNRTFEKLFLTTYAPFDSIQYRFSATYGYEWSFKEGAVLLMLDGGLGVDFNRENAQVMPVVGIGIGFKK